jgi:predicted nucleotidyltransferase/DNA-binding XRE family transcriptional regulator
MGTTGHLIRTNRTRAGLSQRDLAAAAGTSQPAIARYESGHGEPRADTLERLLAACGATIAAQKAPRRTERIPATGPKGRLLRRRRAHVLRKAAEAGLVNVRVFGSVARGEDTDESDIDLLVDLGEDGDVLALYELRDALVPILGRAVDVSCPEVLRTEIRQAALAEAVPL